MSPLESLLRSERQWPKHLRILHAKYKISAATTPEEKSLWQQVIIANAENATDRSERERPAKPTKFKGPATKRLP